MYRSAIQGDVVRVLLVEDDISLAQALTQILKENRYDTDSVYDGIDGLYYAQTGVYDVIILDVMLPNMDGFSITKKLRRTNIDTPIILLTARDSINDKITGLDSGADDYMTKPFSPAELLAHLRALTRRRGEVVFEKLSAFDLSLDLQNHELSCGPKKIQLSYKEFCLAEILIHNQNQVITKEQLIEHVWGADSTAEDNNVEAYISFLRKKLKFLKSTASIETLRKTGYRLTHQ